MRHFRLKHDCAVLAMAACMAVNQHALGDVVYVDDSAPLAGDGRSWQSAFKDLQHALDLASESGSPVTEIRLGQGVYTPVARSGPSEQLDPRTATFALRNGLVIAGGYAGSHSSNPDERDIRKYPTVLTGDLLGNDGPPGNFANYDDNAYHVVTAFSVDETAVLDGVTITAGSACCDFWQFRSAQFRRRAARHQWQPNAAQLHVAV